MYIIYPFLQDELGQLVLWVTIFAGLATALVNGVTDKEMWDNAGRNGAFAVLATMLQALLITFRAVVLGVFLGTIIAGILINRETNQPIIIGAAGISAFIADPVLRAIKKNWDKVVHRILGGSFIEGDDVPEDNRSASAGNLDE